MSRWILYFLLLLLMMIWGFNVVAIKILVNHFPPVFITSLRVFSAGLVVISYLLTVKIYRRLTLRQYLFIFITSLFGVLGHHIFLALGLKVTTGSNGGLISRLVPLTTSIFAMLFLGDRLTKLRLLGIISGFLGVCFIVLNGNSEVGTVSIGDIYMLGAVITQAISFIFIKKLTNNIESRQVTGVMLVMGSILLFAISLVMEPGSVETLTGKPLYVWLVFLGSAIFATGLGHMLYNYAIHQLGAGETAIFTNLTPFFALVGSALFLKEVVTSAQIFGFIFIIIGVVFGTGSVDAYLQKKKIKNYRERKIS